MSSGWSSDPSAAAHAGQVTELRAGFWRRFVALLVDSLIVAIPIGILEHLAKSSSYAIGLLISAAYFTYFEGGPTGAGYGKRLLGIRVVDFDTGGPIGYVRGFVRYITRALSALVLYLGYFWMLWDPEKQCWHDKFANDVVVPVS